jgi:hypothetical protein
MEKKFGKNKAGHISSNKTVTMIVSVLVITLFIGLAMQPVLAEPGSEQQVNEEECIPCKAGETPQPIPPCTTCACAVDFAVDYGLKYAKDKVDAKMIEENGVIYDGFLVDLVLWIREGIREGFTESGFQFNVDVNELQTKIEYWVNKKIAIPEHDLAKIVAALSGILKGVGEYLKTECKGETSKTLNEPLIMQILSMKLPFVYKIISFISNAISSPSGEGGPWLMK